MTADAIIASLNAYVPASLSGANAGPINEILRPYYGGLPEHHRVIPALFELMERWPDADWGMPGPLVHCIEGQPLELYEPLLLRSLERRPVYSTVWMLRRILSSDLDAAHRERLESALAAVAGHPLASDETKEFAADED